MAPLSRTEREALKAILRHTGRAREGAHTGALADAIGMSAATVTAVLKRLAERGLVDHRPYHGSVLTREGTRAATIAMRRHRIVERFLADFLGYAWHESDQLAPSFEHDLPQEVEDRLFAALGAPTTCPHGFPIPGADARALPDVPPLYGLEPGDVAVVAVAGSADHAVLEFLNGIGLRPGARVQVREKHPFDGPLVLRVGGRDRIVGEQIARQLFVQKHIHRKEPA